MKSTKYSMSKLKKKKSFSIGVWRSKVTQNKACQMHIENRR